MMLEPCESLCELIIKTGAVVDSITFVTTKCRRKFGGNGGNAEHKVTFSLHFHNYIHYLIHKLVLSYLTCIQ